jgi:hypothetical protein
MQSPPWQPPRRPAPFTPAQSPGPVAVGPALLLRAPLWAPQQDEHPAEHAAFLAWLMGGYEVARPGGAPRKDGVEPDLRLVVRGNWAAALGVLGGTSAQVHALAVKWSWEVRGREYWTTTRAIGEAAVRAQEESVLEFAALARELDREWLGLLILEVRKARVEAERIAPAAPGQEQDTRFLPRIFDNRELVAAYRASGGLEVQRFRSGIQEKGKDATAGHDVTDWAQLPPADLETFRKLRDKARAGQSGQ